MNKERFAVHPIKITSWGKNNNLKKKIINAIPKFLSLNNKKKTITCDIHVYIENLETISNGKL